MATPDGPSRTLPDRPVLRFLKDEAKRRIKKGEFATLAKAQLAIAREHGFASWSRLKEHIDSIQRPEPQYQHDYELKKAGLERLLGPMDTASDHSLIPFHAGGSVDMYYFPNGIPGTAFATMELIEPDGSGSKPNAVGTFELVAFTKHKRPLDGKERDATEPFNAVRQRINAILTVAGRFSYKAVLKPGDTAEIPGAEGEANRCLILDEYQKEGRGFEIDGKRHCLLLCIEVLPPELEYAREHGGDALLSRLRIAGYWPYSDLDRSLAI